MDAARVEIREPFPQEALPRIWAWTEPFRRQVADDAGPRTVEEFVEFMMAVGGRARTWGVWRDGELGGVLWFEPTSPWAGIAHVIFKKSFWGRKTTVPAVKAALDAVFGSGVRKVSAVVFADNHAAQAIYRKLGFRDEGHFREHTMRGGVMVDMVACGLTVEDWNVANGRARGAPGRIEQLEEQPDHDGDQRSVVHAGADESAKPDAEHDLERPLES